MASVTKEEKEIGDSLREEMDYWVKQFQHKLQATEQLNLRFEENIQNTDYNYELIKEIQNQIGDLKKEIECIRHSLVIALRSRPLKEVNY